jgi:acetyl-CoA carboxylase carboxyl transferase subunit alpha
LLKFGIIDAIVPEPVGGAHRDSQAAIRAAGDAIEAALVDLGRLDAEGLRNHRADKFLAMGRKKAS